MLRHFVIWKPYGSTQLTAHQRKAQSQKMLTSCEGTTLKQFYEIKFFHQSHPLIFHKPLFRLFFSTEHSHGSPKLKIPGVFGGLT
jgi:hypothetical protein